MDPFPVPSAINYPDVNEEKIPDTVELTRLSALIQSREETMRDLGPQREEVQNNVEVLRQLYEEQKRTLGETLSNLKAAEKRLKVLEEQISLARNDLVALRSPMHPIRRCPTDILRCIFEWSVPTHIYPGFVTATHISHVCYRWRQVALQTPALWTYIAISLKMNPRDVGLFWLQSVERIRRLAATILIEDITNVENAWLALSKCRFNLLHRIKRLEFWLSTNDAANHFTTLIFDPPPGGIQCLAVGSDWNTPRDSQVLRDDQILRADFTGFFNQFSGLKSVVIEDFVLTSFSANFAFESVSELKIRRCNCVPLGSLSRVFPTTSSLYFEDVEFFSPFPLVTNWPSVNSLAISKVKHIPWSSFSLPGIKKLSLSDSTTWGPAFKAFLESHPSLVSLDTDFHNACGLANSAPQILSLSLNGLASEVNIDFPNLLILELFQYSGYSIPVKEFETIVRQYFFPPRKAVGHQNITEEDRPSPSFTISVPKSLESIITLQWRECALLSLAVEESSVTWKRGTEYTSYCFAWK